MPGPQPCHCIPFIFCIVGRGLDPSGGVGDAAPYNNPQGFSLPQTSAAAWGQAALHPTLPHSVGRAFARNSFTPPRRGRACPARSLAHCIPFIFCIVGRSLDPSGGVGDAAPYNNPQGFSLPQTSAAAWGQAALHPTLPHSVGRAFARNSFTPPRRGRACQARSLAIVSPLFLHRREGVLTPPGASGTPPPTSLAANFPPTVGGFISPVSSPAFP